MSVLKLWLQYMKMFLFPLSDFPKCWGNLLIGFKFLQGAHVHSEFRFLKAFSASPLQSEMAACLLPPQGTWSSQPCIDLSTPNCTGCCHLHICSHCLDLLSQLLPWELAWWPAIRASQLLFTNRHPTGLILFKPDYYWQLPSLWIQQCW